MRLSKETIDKEKNACYEKRRGRISIFITEPRGELNKERLLKALSLILSEKDVTDYFKTRGPSFRPAEKDFKIKKRVIF